MVCQVCLVYLVKRVNQVFQVEMDQKEFEVHQDHQEAVILRMDRRDHVDYQVEKGNLVHRVLTVILGHLDHQALKDHQVALDFQVCLV